MGYAEEFLVAGAGPGVNLLLAAMLARMPGGEVLAGISLALAVLNLLPVRNLDGARMLRCGLSAAVGDRISVEILRCLDFCFTAIFACAGFWISLRWGNLTLLLMCLWLVFRSKDNKMSFFQKKYGERGCQKGLKRLK
jgi:stage IV sporulation protein FB